MKDSEKIQRMEAQASDAFRKLWVRETPWLSREHTPVIYFGYGGSEVISLAVATHQHIEATKQRATIVLIDKDSYSHSTLEKDEKWYFLQPVRLRDEDVDFYVHESDATRNSDTPEIKFHGNAPGFKYYSEEKRLSAIILRQAGILTPRELCLRHSRFLKYKEREKNLNLTGKSFDETQHYLELFEQWLKLEQARIDYTKIEAFFQAIGTDKRIVLKPNRWSQWKGIKMFDYKTFVHQKNEVLDYLMTVDVFDSLLIQEKVDSYHLEENGVRKDWNARVLVTYNYETQEFVSAGIVIRIDNDGWPVNRSLSADFISLETVAQMAWWDEATYLKVKHDFETTAIKSVKAIKERSWKKLNSPEAVNKINAQVLAGVDIIADQNLQMNVLEVNDVNSGCMYELMELYGTKALYVISECILTKAILWGSISSLLSTITEKIPAKYLMKALKDGTLEVTESEDGGVDGIIITMYNAPTWDSLWWSQWTLDVEWVDEPRTQDDTGHQ